MRKVFSEYYSPTGDDYKKLLTEALIVVDANVLLHAYRLPKLGREALFDTLEKLKERLWIPYQVGLEFQANRLAVITEVIGKFDSVLSRGKESLTKIREEVQQLELERRGTDIDDAGLKECLENATSELEKIVAKARTDGAAISHDDPIRDRIDAIIGEHIGPPPESQDSIDKLSQQAQARFDSSIPPGFEDEANKGKDPAKSGRYARGIRHERKYGDYYLWRQTLDHVKESQAKVVLFVTSDSKKDWWLIESGKTLGPLPSLISEMQTEAGCPLFWMYNLRNFLDQASVHLHVNISDEALMEVKESEENLMHDNLLRLSRLAATFRRVSPKRPKMSFYVKSRQVGVEEWYKSRGFNAFPANDPDELVIASDVALRGVRILDWDPGVALGAPQYEVLLEAVKQAAASAKALAPEVEIVVIVSLDSDMHLALESEGVKEALWYIWKSSGASALHIGMQGWLTSFRPIVSFESTQDD